MAKENRFYKRITSMKRWQMMFYDVLSICLTYGLAIGALTITNASDFNHITAIIALPVVIAFKLIVYIVFKLYRLVLDNAGFDEVFKIAVGVMVSNIILAIIIFVVPNFEFIPEIYLIFTTVFEIFIMIIPRILKRIVKYISPRKIYLSGKRSLLIGAGAGGKLVLDEIRNNLNIMNNPIAFVDDDDNKIGNIMSGFPILGPIEEVPYIIDSNNIEEVIICIANIDDQRF